MQIPPPDFFAEENAKKCTGVRDDGPIFYEVYGIRDGGGES